jgi:hypothetical protein
MIALLPFLALQSHPAPINLDSLLAELVDRSALARLPSPPYVCRQASSHDRASASPEKEREGRTEGVMLDTDGPGAIVRVGSAHPAGTLRFYLDGAATPVIAEEMARLLGGQGPVASPLSAETSKGWNLYLPIPYTRHCKVTCDHPKDVDYQIDYRTYPAGTAVASFAPGDLGRSAPALVRVIKLWEHPGEGEDGAGTATFDFTLSRENTDGTLSCVDPKAAAGPRAITGLSFRVEATDLPLALRRAVLRMSFDGEETIACPLGDFFASSPGLNPYRSWPITIAKGADEPTGRPGTQGDLVCRWVMPYRERFDLRVDVRGSSDVHVAGLVLTEPWSWDDRSLHFHGRWKASGVVRTRPVRDWTQLAVEGHGVFVGDMLSIANPVKAWWGEGGETFYVDGETFPSHFGTGTEHDSGSAQSSPELFQAPLHARTRCDGPGMFGSTSVTRFRGLDAIPFEKSLRFDVQLRHRRDCQVEMAATTFYYARPGAKDDAPPIRDGDLAVPHLEWKPFRIEGAVEAEDLKVFASSPGTQWVVQELDDEAWSGGRHLWVRARAKGGFVELSVPVEKPGRREVIVYPTRSSDYGTVQFHVDGVHAGLPLVTFDTEGPGAGAPRPYSLGTFDLAKEMRLRIEVVGTHERSDPPHFEFGLDCVVLR